MSIVEQGFNSDIIFEGITYHVQTEDWGENNPFVVTRVYHSGAVVLSIKTPYRDVEKVSLGVGRLAIRTGMRDQHQKVLDQLVSGAIPLRVIR
jgi:hypothetical protein